MRGKVICFYNPFTTSDVPLFSIGPDYNFTIGELIAFNLAMFVTHPRSNKVGDAYKLVFFWSVIIQNVSYLMTVLIN